MASSTSPFIYVAVEVIFGSIYFYFHLKTTPELEDCPHSTNLPTIPESTLNNCFNNFKGSLLTELPFSEGFVGQLNLFKCLFSKYCRYIDRIDIVQIEDPKPTPNQRHSELVAALLFGCNSNQKHSAITKH